jgi:hypothetical protein
VIPANDLLEQNYPAQEVAMLADLRGVLSKVKDVKVRAAAGRQALRQLWDDDLTFLEKTAWIRTKEPGVISLLRLNHAQRRFWDDVFVRCRNEKRPTRAVVLKARQLGFSTLIQAWQYGQCDGSPNRVSLTISYDEPSSRELFRKAKFVHQNMWFPQGAERDSGTALELDNGSVFNVRTSGNLSAGRGDTFHHLHCSEVPMWADAGETLASAQQAVPAKPGTSIILESTAKGAVGEFYDLWRASEAGRSDYVPFFAPWFWDPEYVLEFPSADAEAAFARTLDLVERRLVEAHRLTMPQLAWRRWKIRNDLQGSAAKFRQEYPSTATEAFLTTGTPVFDADAIEALERNAARPLWTGDIHLEV